VLVKLWLINLKKGAINMASEDVLSGARAAFILFDAYLGTVAQELGMERAVGLLTKMCESMGAIQGQMLKQQAGVKQADAKTGGALAITVPESLGIALQVIEESPQKAVWKAGRCSLYEAAQMLGMDAKSMCRAGPLRFMDTVVKQLNPNLSWQVLKYRSSADDFCEEACVLGKPSKFPE
jgi:hypothetical protein